NHSSCDCDELRSRMRQSRTSGSVGGDGGDAVVYPTQVQGVSAWPAACSGKARIAVNGLSP
ncbi:MAG: hypothetical protein AAF756_07645, partial [Pseudomonadota bacterium]